ncbi:MAG: hypothetical protein HQK77_20790 [Desulfobacterales bacterium]|nr:hypothetical protein [Desulfobacterales bacterium]
MDSLEEDENSVEYQIKCLQDTEDSTNRYCAAVELGRMKDTRAVLPLIQALSDPEESVDDYFIN